MANNGLDRIGEALKKHQADILLTVAAAATADNKFKAIAQSVKDIAIWRMIGPLGIVLGSASGILGTFRMLVRESGALDAALRKLSQIQGLQRQFDGLLRSASAAKQRVAELMQVASRSSFKLGEVGQAGRALEILTRGSYASAEALRTMADAAAGTGNRIEDTGQSVGEFYEDLQQGKPVDAAAEKLRAMGLISEQTARRVVELQQGGAAFSTVWGAVTADLGRFNGAATAQRDSLDGVRDSYEKAREALAEKFGEPFSQAEIDNIRNTTAILTALGPVAQQVSGYIAALINPISNVATRFGAWALGGQSVQQALAQAATAVVTFTGVVLGLGAAFGLAKLGEFVVWLGRIAVAGSTASASTAGFAQATVSARAAVAALSQGNVALAASEAAVAVRSTAAATAVRLLGLAMRALPWIALVTAISTAIQLFTTWKQSSEEAARAVDEIHKSTDEAVNRLRDQAAAMQTLEDQTQALADANRDLAAAYKEYFDLVAKPVTSIEQMNGSRQKQKDAAEAKVERLREERDAIAGRQGLAPIAAEQDLQRERFAAQHRLRESAFQGALERANPDEAQRLRERRLRELDALAAFGERGRAGRTATERARTLLGQRINSQETEVASAQAQVDVMAKTVHTPEVENEARQILREETAELNRLKREQERVGLGSRSQSVALETRANLMSSGQIPGSPAEIASLRLRAQRARAIEDEAPQNRDRANELRQTIETSQREIEFNRRRLAMEAEIAGLKSRGVERAEAEWEIRRKYLESEIAIEKLKGPAADKNVLTGLQTQIDEGDRAAAEARRAAAVAQVGKERELAIGAAEIKGDSKEATKLRDLDRFAAAYEELLGAGFGEAKAKELATQFGSQGIERDAYEANRSAVVDSLQRIGGGGGVGSDPMRSIAERQADLQRQMTDYLRVIAERSADSGFDTGGDYEFE